jgi:hypothetical protein
MTEAEADQRIILSRQTLHSYVRMVDAGDIPVADMGLMNDELDMLERIASRHPLKMEKIRVLGEEWLSLTARIRARLN